MRILVLEDSIERIKYFIERYANYELVLTESAFAAIEYLSTDTYDYIFLDNDLGPDNGSGVDVAAFLASGLSINSGAIVIIHSWNVPAVAAMQVHLPKAYDVPYGSMDFFGLELRNRGS